MLGCGCCWKNRWNWCETAARLRQAALELAAPVEAKHMGISYRGVGTQRDSRADLKPLHRLRYVRLHFRRQNVPPIG
jgi:hypothetical protein